MLPPSPAVTQGLVRPSTQDNLQAADQDKADKMEMSETHQRQSPSSSPDTESDQVSDFVVVPNSLAGDSSRNKNMHTG